MALKADATLILPVNVTGKPAPTVTWYFNEEPLSLSGELKIETKDTSSTLTFKGVKGTNSGVFKVKAENVVDSVSAEFNITVKGRSHVFLSKML